MKKLFLSALIATFSLSTLAAEMLTEKEFSYIKEGVEMSVCQELGLKSDIDVVLPILPLNKTRPDVFEAFTRNDLSYVIPTMTNEQFLSLGTIQGKVKGNPAKYCK